LCRASDFNRPSIAHKRSPISTHERATIKRQIMDSKVESKEESRDEVDFIQTSTAGKKEICVSCKSFNPLKKGFLMRNNNNNNGGSTQSSSELQTAVKSHISALEKLHLFHFPRSKKQQESSEEKQQQQRPQRLIKSSSIARLFGNTYNTKKQETNNSSANANSQLKKSQSVSEKFSNRASESDEEFVLRVSEHNFNLSACVTNLSSLDLSNVPMDKPVSNHKKGVKNFTKGLGKLLRRNHSSVEISPPDPEYKVLYLGNVLTGWAKGESLSHPLLFFHLKFHHMR
jgi:hypothetical protein